MWILGVMYTSMLFLCIVWYPTHLGINSKSCKHYPMPRHSKHHWDRTPCWSSNTNNSMNFNFIQRELQRTHSIHIIWTEFHSCCEILFKNISTLQNFYLNQMSLVYYTVWKSFHLLWNKKKITSIVSSLQMCLLTCDKNKLGWLEVVFFFLSLQIYLSFAPLFVVFKSLPSQDFLGLGLLLFGCLFVVLFFVFWVFYIFFEEAAFLVGFVFFIFLFKEKLRAVWLFCKFVILSAHLKNNVCQILTTYIILHFFLSVLHINWMYLKDYSLKSKHATHIFAWLLIQVWLCFHVFFFFSLLECFYVTGRKSNGFEVLFLKHVD